MEVISGGQFLILRQPGLDLPQHYWAILNNFAPTKACVHPVEKSAALRRTTRALVANAKLRQML